MKKYIEIPEEALEHIESGRFVGGSLHRCKQTGKIVFNAYRRRGQRKKERTIRLLENGWLKESATRIKFFNSVKKELGFRLVNVAIHRDLKDAMEVLEMEELLDRI